MTPLRPGDLVTAEGRVWWYLHNDAGEAIGEPSQSYNDRARVVRTGKAGRVLVQRESGPQPVFAWLDRPNLTLARRPAHA